MRKSIYSCSAAEKEGLKNEIESVGTKSEEYKKVKAITSSEVRSQETTKKVNKKVAPKKNDKKSAQVKVQRKTKRLDIEEKGIDGTRQMVTRSMLKAAMKT